MTRKDYILIANALSTIAITIEGEDEAALFEAIVDQLAIVLQLDNPRFDRARFASAAIGGR